MALHSTVLTAWVLLLGATVPCFAEKAPKHAAHGHTLRISGLMTPKPITVNVADSQPGSVF